MTPLNETLDIVSKINENLGQQTEQLQNIDTKLDTISKNNKETKKELQIMNSYFYSFYYWMTSFFGDNEDDNKEINKTNPQNSDHLTKINIDQDNILTSQLEELERLTVVMGDEMDYQNKLLDKIEDKNIKNNENIKKNNLRIDKL